MQELQRIVAETADRLGLHASAPTLLLDLQVRLGALTADVVRATEHGRRPFRGSASWEPTLGDLAFALVSLADQTGVDLDRATRGAAERLYRSAGAGGAGAAGAGPQPPEPNADATWPLSG